MSCFVQMCAAEVCVDRFVLYTALIGGDSNVGGCHKPLSRHDDVFLQYSVDGG